MWIILAKVAFFNGTQITRIGRVYADLFPAEGVDERIDIGFDEIQYRLDGVEAGFLMEIQGTPQVMPGAVCRKKLYAGSGISLDFVFKTIDVGFRSVDALLVDGGGPDGMVERKCAGVFHQLIEVFTVGYRHVAEVYPGVELRKPDIHPTGLRICRAVGFHFGVGWDVDGKGAAGGKGMIRFFGEIDSEISPGLG